jgi:hypothetical protein
MAEVGIDIATTRPRRWTEDDLRVAVAQVVHIPAHQGCLDRKARSGRWADPTLERDAKGSRKR